MEVFEAVRTALAVRAYQDKPVPPDVMRRIVEAAHLTASSQNKQPWHFIAVDDRAMLQRIAEVATTGPYTVQAAFAVVVVIENERPGVSDGSRAIQSMVLTAWSEGVGSNWVGGLGNLDGLKPLLGIPENLHVLAVTPFGYPTRQLGRGKKNRKPFGEVVHHGRYGQPFA